MQVACTGSTSTRDTWLAKAQAEGYPTYTVFLSSANCWRLRIGQFYTEPTAAQKEAFRVEVAAKGLTFGSVSWPLPQTVVEGETRYKLTRGTDVVSALNAVVLESPQGVVRIGTARYRGKAEVAVNGSGKLVGINELPFEQYLYGVVPRELGPVAYPELEAQKVQAVAARTWALASYNKRISEGYNLRATTDDQVYGGLGAEHPISTAAVDGTAGVVATYNGRLISAFYSSTSGGHTASYEEWLDGAQPIPYLKGVPDAERGRALEHVPSLEVFRAHPNPVSLRATKEGDFDSDWGRYHRWSFEWSMDEISRVISLFAGKPVGKVLAINVLERGPSGRVLKIEYVTENGTYTSTRNGIRSSLKYINASGNPANLLSTLFFIEPVLDRRTKEVVGYKVYGGGFGHGVGMSQTGAVGMASKKHTYDEILKHYYQGIELVKQY